MDNYKFGNLICTMREAHGLTQKEFAEKLAVSDKAVSKWENGQAIPRMDTLEKMAAVLGTTVEELITLSRENIKRVLIKNAFGTLLHFQLDGEIVSLKADEEKWLLLDAGRDTHEAVVFGELKLTEFLEDEEAPQGFKDKLVQKGLEKATKWLDKKLERAVIRAKCYYRLSNLADDEVIEVENEFFSAGDKMWIFKDLDFSYPKLLCQCKKELVNAECLNEEAVFADFRKMALTSELGISIPFMLLAYPFRKRYFKNAIKPSGLMKYLNKADYYVEKNGKEEEKAKKIKHPVLRMFGIILLAIIVWVSLDVGLGILGVASDKPYLVSADYSTITYGRETYTRVDDLPKDAISEKLLGAEVWDDARIDGYSKTDQYLDEHKVCTYTDKAGDTYLWLILDYGDTAWDEETGKYKEYDDYTEHYVYKLQP